MLGDINRGCETDRYVPSREALPPHDPARVIRAVDPVRAGGFGYPVDRSRAEDQNSYVGDFGGEQMKTSRIVRGSSSTHHAKLIALAAASVPFIVSTARATYTDADTFIGVTAATTFAAATLNDPAEWSTGALPTVTELAVFPSSLNVSIATPKPTPNVTMYMYALTSSSSQSTGGTIANGQAIGFLSTDTTSDGVSTAPALQATTGATSQAIDIKTPIVLGNAASTTLQIATFDNSIADNAVTTEGTISEFPGSIWGVNITGSVTAGASTGKRVQFKSSNYFNQAFAYSGDTTIAFGGVLRLYNNIIPHYAGRGNMNVNGTLLISANSGSIIFNGFNGAATGVVDRVAGNSIAFGAADASGEFDGFLKYTGLSMTKVGAGTETLTNATNANQGAVILDGGVLAVTSIANAGTVSALGSATVAGNASLLVFDGGTLQYTGPAVSADRLFTINASGGGIDASGTGALNLTNASAVPLTDNITRPAEVSLVTGGPVTEAIKMPSTANLVAGMAVAGGSLPGGTTIVSVDSSSQITVSANRTATIGSGAAADTLTFTQTVSPDRTFTLSGSNTGANTLTPILGNSTNGGKLSLIKSGPGTWLVNGANTYTGLTIVKGGALVANAAASTVILTPAGAGADIQNGEIAFDYTGGVSPATAIRAILTAEAGSHFATGQLMSSSAAADATHLTTLGYADAADVGLSAGSDPLPSAVVVKYTYVGDGSLDGKVDLGNDFPLFLEGYLNHALLTDSNLWSLGDYNYDGVVNNTDFGLFIDGYKAQNGSLGALDDVIAASPLLSNAQKASLLSVVPEPTTLGATAVAGLAMLSRRRRK
jgi:autotransporter-associated beta strand protein